MQIVIDIPDGCYEELNNGQFPVQDAYRLVAWINNGTPLPEGAEILTKEAYSDLCVRAADVPDKNVGELISRQAVIDRINRLIEVEKKQGTDDWGYGRERVNAYEAMLHMVESEYLHPSVEPERKPGHWEWDQRTGEYVCSECGRNPIYERTTPDVSEMDKYRYCRWCGAPMEVDG